jgi:hypothetical protein
VFGSLAEGNGIVRMILCSKRSALLPKEAHFEKSR